MTLQLDMNNGLLMGLAGNPIRKLLLIQNMAARVVSHTRVNKYITHVLMGLKKQIKTYLSDLPFPS